MEGDTPPESDPAALVAGMAPLAEDFFPIAAAGIAIALVGRFGLAAWDLIRSFLR